MNNREMVLAEFQNKPENTLIMTGQLYREKYANMMSKPHLLRSSADSIEAVKSSVFQKASTVDRKRHALVQFSLPNVRS